MRVFKMVKGQRTASSTKASASNNQTTKKENHQYNFIRNSHASRSDKSGDIPSWSDGRYWIHDLFFINNLSKCKLPLYIEVFYVSRVVTRF